MPAADGAIIGAHVRTLDADRPAATAIAWRDGVIVAVGADDEVRGVCGAGTRADRRTRGDGRPRADRQPHPSVLGHARHARGRPAQRGDARRGPRPAGRRSGGAAATGRGCSATAPATSRSTPRACAPTRSRRRSAAHRRCSASSTATPRSPAGRRSRWRASPARASFAEFAEIVCRRRREPDRRAARERRHGPRPRRRPRRGPRPRRLDAYAGTLRALNRVGLTGAHVMVGDPGLLDDVRAARGARRPHACGC